LPIIAARLARAGALAAGVAAAIFYARAGLTLSHYDAKAHLVVARRVFDSLFPGWHQIGAVWLPLPHLMNALPVQIDAWYRSGFSGVVISVASLALAAGAAAAIVARLTGSTAGGLAAAALIALDPNVLYLQSTPMTEPLLFALTLAAIERLMAWLQAADDARRSLDRQVGLTLAAACWTRYEAWPIAVAALALTACARLLAGARMAETIREVGRLARWPAAAIAVFFVNSRATVGAWFVSSGFFVAENPALGDPKLALEQIVEGATALAGRPLVWTGAAGAAAVVVCALRRRERDAALLVTLAPAAAGALPFYAFLEGHPYRARYIVAVVVALGLLAGTLIGLLRRIAPRLPAAAAVGLVAIVVAARPPFAADAPIVRESQRDIPQSRGRAAVTAYLAREWDGQPIMASMGSLAHYMQETSHAGFNIRDYLHEGNGDLWIEALKVPQPHAAWILIEERAEGGDMLAVLSRQHPAFLSGYQRVAEGGGVALYRRIRISTPP
jgi:hypothetical protein